jgi:hypothetical protein
LRAMIRALEQLLDSLLAQEAYQIVVRSPA